MWILSGEVAVATATPAQRQSDEMVAVGERRRHEVPVMGGAIPAVDEEHVGTRAIAPLDIVEPQASDVDRALTHAHRMASLSGLGFEVATTRLRALNGQFIAPRSPRVTFGLYRLPT